MLQGTVDKNGCSLTGIRVTGKGLEPSAIARRPGTKLQKSPSSARKSPRYCSTETCSFCENQEIFRIYKLNTFLPNIWGALLMVETKCGCRFLCLKLDIWPRSAISYLPFSTRRPRRVLLTSFTADVTSKLARDDWGRGYAGIMSTTINSAFKWHATTCDLSPSQQLRFFAGPEFNLAELPVNSRSPQQGEKVLCVSCDW